ncbi:hypothetical protein [Propionivibrio sp.]|uniref:hypothetical protein n=1 Tax=Propionivibrio sp. TaxID=2212460 RepID=UPI003BF315B7
MTEINSSLYWSMPGPAEFIGRITDASRNARAIILSFTDYPPNGVWHAVKTALHNANINEPVELDISEGTNIPVEIGMHFSNGVMPAELLAHHKHGYQHAVILKANGKKAQKSCEKYAAAFVSAIDHSQGDVRLIVGVHDGENQKDGFNRTFHVIAFDGALSDAEIEAYVTQRMVTRGGPGSTRLARHLVTEYAGFDPALAEQLISFDTSRILALPESLTPLLGTNLLRWSKDSWLAGTRAEGMVEAHPLLEWHRATHTGNDQAAFQRAADARYWRACLKALIPWLEERRSKILKILDTPLCRVEKAHGGTGKITKKKGDRMVGVPREELEYNDLAYFASTKEFSGLSNQEFAAVSVCKKAKFVRDDLAHLRRPPATSIESLIADMDRLVS